MAFFILASRGAVTLLLELLPLSGLVTALSMTRKTNLTKNRVKVQKKKPNHTAFELILISIVHNNKEARNKLLVWAMN